MNSQTNYILHIQIYIPAEMQSFVVAETGDQNEPEAICNAVLIKFRHNEWNIRGDGGLGFMLKSPKWVLREDPKINVRRERYSFEATPAYNGP